MPNDEPTDEPVGKPAPKKRRRGAGKKLGKGQDHPNSTKNRNIKKAEIDALKAKLAAIEERDRTEAASRDEQGGVVSAERMKRVMGQPPEQDRGPTEQRLREWLNKDVRTYTAEMAKLAAADRDVSGLQAEVEKLRLEVATLKKATAGGVDEGSDEADRLIDRILAEHSQ